MADIQPRHRFNTRIVLKHDFLSNWISSKIELLPGELAISYERDDLSSLPQEIKLKVGCYSAEKNRNLHWNELPFVGVDEETVEKQLCGWVREQARIQIKEDFNNPSLLSTYITTDTIPIGDERIWIINGGDSKQF